MGSGNKKFIVHILRMQGGFVMNSDLDIANVFIYILKIDHMFVHNYDQN